MKQISKLLIAILLLAVGFTACDKKDALPSYAAGTTVALSSTTTNPSLAIADSSKTAIGFSWTNPNYAQDSSLYKYVLEIDTTGHKFSNSVKFIVTGARNTSLTVAQINNSLAAIGVKLGTSATLDTRVTSSYGNNNEQYYSNTIVLKASSYTVPFLVAVSPSAPITLNIANASSNALTFNWGATNYGNYKVTYSLQIDVASGTFANPQTVSFDTAHKGNISVGDLNTKLLNLGVVPGTNADVQYRIVAKIATTPANTLYSNVITNKVTPYLPFLYLWVPGDYQGWNPGAPAPQLGATLPDLNSYEGYVNVPSGGTYEFKINNAPDWNHISYGSGGANLLSTSGGNLVWPNGGGTYLVKANPSTLSWSATKTTWSIIGSATPGGWNSDTPMTYDAVNQVWVINAVPLIGGQELKLRANNDWGINFGGDLNNLSYGGGNIPIATSGTFKITLNLNSPLKYTLTIQ